MSRSASGPGWNEHRARRSSASRTPTRSGGWTGSRRRSRSCAGSGTSPTAGRSTVSTTRSAGRCSARRDGDRTSSSAAPASRARCGSRRPTRTSTTSARPPPDEVRDDQCAPRCGVREGRPRPGDDHPLGHGRRARRARRGGLRAARRGPDGDLRRPHRQRRGPGSTHGVTAGSSGHPTPRASASRPTASRRRPAALPGLPAARPRPRRAARR